ncbi:MAG: amidohydrolase [Myxococcales bacterium]|nr:amidohydrolase [Myxococcales bacterium]
MTTADRYLMISADCHAAPRLDDVREYVDPAWRESFDSWRAQLADRGTGRLGEPLFDEQAQEEFRRDVRVDGGAMNGIWDSERRTRELRADGVVAEVIFPGGATTKDGEAGNLPFDVGIATYQYQQEAALWQAGVHAYNRWLADFCAEAPGERAGVGLIAVDDVDVAVEEVRWLREHGVFGGILLPGGAIGIGDLPPAYHHPRYEPLWAVCADLAMPMHTHSGWTPDLGGHPGSIGIFLSEILYWAHRPFGFLVWSGVFERYPALRLVMTEQKADWMIGTLELMDSRYELPMFAQLRRSLPRKPSEYYERQCYIGASFMDEGEWEARRVLGVEHLIWGSDYPHLEGSWPHTVERLAHTFKDVPRDEVSRLIGLTAATVYGFDRDQLALLAAEHGPELERIGCP